MLKLKPVTPPQLNLSMGLCSHFRRVGCALR